MIGHWNRKKKPWSTKKIRRRFGDITRQYCFFCQIKRKIKKTMRRRGQQRRWRTCWVKGFLLNPDLKCVVRYGTVWFSLVFFSVVLYTACKTISDKSVYPLYCEILCHSLINGILMVAASTVINHVRCSNISVHSECALEKKTKKSIAYKCTKRN